RTSSSSTATPCLRAKPAAAFPRSFSGGPWTHSSGSRSGASSEIRTSRRGVAKPLPPKTGSHRSRICARASAHAEAGSSSQPISKSRLGNLLHVLLGHPTGEAPNPSDVGGALRDGDGAAGVEQVEGVRALQHLVIGRARGPPRHELAAFGLVLVEAAPEDVDRGKLEVVDRPLALVLAVDVAPFHSRRPVEVEG